MIPTSFTRSGENYNLIDYQTIGQYERVIPYEGVVTDFIYIHVTAEPDG
jgi:hypothetical protein